MMFAKKMSILNWLCQREFSGTHTFSFQEVQASFPSMRRAIIQNELYRLLRQKDISAVHKGFYVRVPAHYRMRECVPPDFYIDQLMEYLGKPYYIGLLSAGELHGAAHQRPQRFCVFTTLPVTNTSERTNPIIAWNYRRLIPEELLLRKNSETGEIRYSNAELTAIDLVQYSQYIGGLSRSATVLAELLEKTDFKRANAALYEVGTIAAFQRLGYIIEEVLGDSKQAEDIYSRLKESKTPFRWIPLSREVKSTVTTVKNARWHIHINVELEVDDI